MTPHQTPFAKGLSYYPAPLGIALDELGECGVWWPERNELWWTDVRGPSVHVLELESLELRHFDLPELAGGMCLTDEDDLLIGLEKTLSRLDPDTGELTTLVVTDRWSPGMRFNEIKCDPWGRVWAGYMNDRTREPVGWLFRLDDDALVPVLDGVAVPNSLVWSPDGRTMYFSDGVEPTIDAFEFDVTSGTISGRREVLRFAERGVPDGIALDANGQFWCAHYGGGRIVRLAADGSIEQELLFPVSQPTTVTFAGHELELLFITTARQRLSAEQLADQPHAGDLFAFRPAAPGAPVPRARLRVEPQRHEGSIE